MTLGKSCKILDNIWSCNTQCERKKKTSEFIIHKSPVLQTTSKVALKLGFSIDIFNDKKLRGSCSFQCQGSLKINRVSLHVHKLDLLVLHENNLNVNYKSLESWNLGILAILVQHGKI